MTRRTSESTSVLYLTFGQGYLEPGSTYQFSCEFQGLLNQKLGRTCRASAQLATEYPRIRKVHFYVTAAKRVPKQPVSLVKHYPRLRETEFLATIPFSWTRRGKVERHVRAARSLIETVADFFDQQGVETSKFRQAGLVVLEELQANFDTYYDTWSLN